MPQNIADSDFSCKPHNRHYRLGDCIQRFYKSHMELKIKELRKAKGLTQRQVAEMAGMSVSYYTELELGRKQINANRLETLAKVFGTTPQGLIAGGEGDEIKAQVEILSHLTPDQRRLVFEMITSLASANGYKPA